jgi:hypothetical protein
MENRSPADRIEEVSSDENIKSEWFIGTETQDVHRVTMLKPKSKPCNEQCPWLAANHDKTVELFYDHEVPGIAMPESFTFATWKRIDIWESGLRNGVHGYGGLCHVRLKGTDLTPRQTWNVVSCQCTGALVMQQRELLRHVEHGDSALTEQGAVRIASDMLGRQVSEDEVRDLDLRALLANAHPSLLDQNIGCDAVAPPLSEHEMNEWGAARSASQQMSLNES